MVFKQVLILWKNSIIIGCFLLVISGQLRMEINIPDKDTLDLIPILIIIIQDLLMELWCS